MLSGDGNRAGEAMSIRLSDVGKTLGWGGLAGVAACLLLKYVEPAPRGDVLACLGISLLGLMLYPVQGNDGKGRS